MTTFLKKTQLSLLLLFLLLISDLSAQISNQTSITVNAVRFIIPYDISEAHYPVFSFLNGLQLEHCLTEKSRLFLGVKRLNYRINLVDWGSRIDTVGGSEIHAGIELFRKQQKKVFLSYYSELFLERTKHRGIITTDHPPTYIINHVKIFYGIATGVRINIKINNFFSFIAGSRVKIGKVHTYGYPRALTGNLAIFGVLYPDRSFFNVSGDILNTFGLRFVL